MENTTLVRKQDAMPDVLGVAGVGTANATTVITMPWWQMLGVRVIRMYLQTFIGLLGTDAAGFVDLGGDAGTAWAHLMNIGLISLAPTTITLLHNLLEYVTKLDMTHPQLRG